MLIYEMRRSVLDKETQSDLLQEQLTSVKLLYEQAQIQRQLSERQNEEQRKQIKYLIEDIKGTSQVKATFIKERVNEKLSELYEKLRVENTEIKIKMAQM